MRPPPFPKPAHPEEALALQRALAKKVRLAGSLEGVRRIAALPITAPPASALIAARMIMLKARCWRR